VPEVAASPRVEHAKRLFAGLPGSYDRMGALLSFGQDPRWRRFMVSRLPADPSARLLDVATGTGMVAREAVRRTGASVVALDLTEEMLRGGVSETAAEGLDGRVRFLLGDGRRLPFADGSFDGLTFTYLMRYVDDVETTLAELARVVKGGGILANLEFHVPANPALKALWLLYTRAVIPAFGRVVSRSWYEVGRFLGPSISSFYERWPLERQLSAWRAAGVGDVRARVMSAGGGMVIWGTKDG